MKTTAATALKDELKYSPMSEGNFVYSRAKPRGIAFKIIQ